MTRLFRNAAVAPAATILSIALALIQVLPAAAQRPDLFTAVEELPSSADLPDVFDEATLRGRVVTLDAARLAEARAGVSGVAGRATLRLNLFDDVVVTGILDRLAPTFSGGYALSGRVADTPSEAASLSGTVTLVVNGPIVVGSIRTSRGTYRIRPAGEGRVAIIETDPSALPSPGPPLRRDPPPFDPPATVPPQPMLAAPAESDPDSVESDRSALVALYEAAGGPSWTTQTNWLSDAPLGEWYGVTTDASGRVSSLELRNNGLAGQVPPELGTLTELRTLYLPDNGLTGSIPAELGSLTNLRYLSLRYNLLTGQLPPLGNLKELRYLNLYSNGLTGPIPRELDDFPNLQRLGLGRNLLTGPLPLQLRSLPELQTVDIGFSDVCAPADADFQAWLAAIDFRGGICSEEDELSIIDLAVFYTPSAEREAETEAGEPVAIAAAIDLMVAETNVAYIDSGARQLLRLVARERVTYKESGDADVDFDRFADPADGHMDEVHTTRDQVGADLVALLTDSTNRVCLGYRPGAFSICTHRGGLSFTHELGHNMGVSHDRFEVCAEIETPCWGVHPFSFGYVNQRAFEEMAPESSRWLTIMAYATQCAEADIRCSRLARFSNPEQMWMGDHLGVPGDAFATGVDGPADAVRTLNMTRRTVANFRRSVAQERLDRTALEAIYEATEGGQWITQTNWLSDAPLGDWYGVTTDATGRVRALALAGNGLRGRLPTDVGTLTTLETLNLAHNALKGPLPRTVWTLTNLRELQLQGNGLSGTLGGDVLTPRNLRDLNLGGNALSGPVPPEMGALSGLKKLELSGTDLTGPLPASLTKLPLDHLRIVGSGLCVPSDAAFQSWLRTIGEFAGSTCSPAPGSSATLDRSALEAIYHATDGPNWRSSTNWLSAEPLGEWEGVRTDADGRVTYLQLGWWGLKGELPPEVGHLSHVRYLFLSGNPDLTGLLPAEVGNLTRLESLQLYDTGLRGPLPQRLGRLAGLRFLRVNGSRMRGPLPQDLTDLGALEWLNLAETALCVPTNDVFQAWLADVEVQSGVQACGPADLRLEPGALTLPVSGVQAVVVEQTQGGAPAAWTVGSTEAWLRVVPAAGLGGGRFTVALDAAALPPEGRGELTGTVVVSWDGLSVRLPVTVPAGTAGAATHLAGLAMGSPPQFGVGEAGDAESQGRGRAGRTVRERGFTSTGPPRHYPDAWAGLGEGRGVAGQPASGNQALDAPAAPSLASDSAVAADRAALVALYNATDGANWRWNQHWLSDKPIGEWQGVWTDDAGRVTTLWLDEYGLVGRIPRELGDLTALSTLDLGNNRLSGGIPAELGNLTRLWRLSLDGNALTGTIPAALANASNLGEIVLGGNALTGAIPSELSGLSRLQRLSLAGNRLTGSIPAWLGETANLRELHLGDNSFTGTIPPELGDLPNLRRLHLQNSGLTGPIPAALGRLRNLVELDLGDNGLTGPIPPDLGGLASLEVAVLSGNELTGPIPVELGALSRLWWLSLRDNQLTGSIPAELESLSELMWLDLAGNSLEDAIPAGLGALPRLQTLSLWRNQLTGSIPATLGTLPALERLYLGDNELTGPIPPQFGEWPTLEHLSLPNNGLTGRLPAAVAAAPRLEMLDLGNNALTGPLPQRLEAASLTWLDVAGNALTGRLPRTLGDLASLRTLSLSGNRFTGALPDSATRLYGLDHLWMGETGLCAPADAVFQGWLWGLLQFDGASCGGSAVVPSAVTALVGPPRGGVYGASAERDARAAGPPVDVRRGNPPVGQVDAPRQGATAVQGTTALTGWVMDDGGDVQVAVYRACLPFDDPTRCESVGGAWLLRLGAAAVVPGARPDVEAAYPEVPPERIAGWGYVIASHLLPDIPGRRVAGGEGPLALYAVATGADGPAVRLGRTLADEEPTRITLANRSLAQPFGAIEMPTAGSTVQGAISTVGWALTPDADTAPGGDDVRVPVDGATTVVYVDGQAWGTVAYDQCRGAVGNPVPPGAFCDDNVANTFGTSRPRAPGTPRATNATRFRNLDEGRGAIGAALIDTTVLGDGAHTLSWSVTDNAGRTAHLGTRYIIVANGSTATARVSDAVPAGVAPDGSGVVRGRQGWDPGAAWEELAADGLGVRHVTLPLLGRLTLHFGGPVTEGHLLGPDGPRPLPPGARLDGATGTFTWGVGPGYLGVYALRFVRPDGALVRVSVTVAPPAESTPGSVHAAIDAPRPDEVVRRSFTVEGWALDESAWQGAGIEAVEVWARQLDVPAAAPVLLGTATLGGRRPAVAAGFGAQFEAAGWRVAVPDLPRGVYDLTAYFRATKTDRFEVARTVRVTVR